ncbi:hypothetical protein B0H13DRAFT_1986284 [Mycena leptocephala]|nr:hypothetical protein B0H13DRAFT_1986284 [Mycena leptocephala]
MPKPLPSGLQVRQAGPDDVPSLAVLLSLAPDDGSLYRFPHILEHSDECARCIIAVVPAEGNDKVVGFTSWTRRETDPEDQTKRDRRNLRRHGIGSLLARWGLDKAAEEHVPVFVTGEARGVDFYENALGFQRLRSTEFWLDKEGEGGLSGAQMVWLPVYKGE